MISLAERIKQLRGTLTQKEFAAKVGINMNTLRAYEKGRTSPPADAIVRMCTNFDVSADWLLLGRAEKKSPFEHEGGAKENLGRLGITPEKGNLPFPPAESVGAHYWLKTLLENNKGLAKENADLRVSIAELQTLLAIAEMKARAAPEGKDSEDLQESA